MHPILYEVNLLLAAGAAAAALVLLGVSVERAILIALTAYLLRHVFRLGHLARLIRRHHRLVPPFPHGLWGDVYRAVAQYQQRGRKGRKRQVRFQRRFREAANSVPDALIVLDKTKRIEWANPAATALMDVQWPRDDGKRLTDLFQRPGLAEYIDAGDYSRPLEVSPEHNQSIMLSLRVAPFGERKKQRLVVGRDITKVFHLNMIRRDFVANASHELRTPLTVIAGFLENLADSPTTPEGHRRPLELMQNQSRRMRSIIEDLLTLSRLEMEDQVTRVAPVDIPRETEMIVADAHALSGGAHRIELKMDEDLLLLGNDSELRSALSNLVFNAIKHTPAGTHVRITWRDDERGALFSVQDDGPGIGAEHIPRLTERFYRVDRARSRASGGTGLGLAIVKHVLHRHDARLIIASSPGQGATFTCRFSPKSRLRRSALSDAPTPNQDAKQDPAQTQARASPGRALVPHQPTA
jgi:two-component system phosphate regulon sensor histidine kinase PhoR